MLHLGLALLCGFCVFLGYVLKWAVDKDLMNFNIDRSRKFP